MVYQNNMQRFILKIIPYFKGSWLIYSLLFKLFPYKWRFCRVEDLNIVLDLSDPPQFSIVKMQKGIVEPATTKFVREYLKEGEVFFDVGANWGYFTCLA